MQSLSTHVRYFAFNSQGRFHLTDLDTYIKHLYPGFYMRDLGDLGSDSVALT